MKLMRIRQGRKSAEVFCQGWPLDRETAQTICNGFNPPMAPNEFTAAMDNGGRIQSGVGSTFFLGGVT